MNNRIEYVVKLVPFRINTEHPLSSSATCNLQVISLNSAAAITCFVLHHARVVPAALLACDNDYSIESNFVVIPFVHDFPDVEEIELNAADSGNRQ